MSRVRPKQAEGLQFLSDYQTAFTTREDGSSWSKHERTWLNVGWYFRGLLRPGSSNTVTDIAEKMHIDQERLERFVPESPWAHENVESELRGTRSRSDPRPRGRTDCRWHWYPEIRRRKRRRCPSVVWCDWKTRQLPSYG